jgi:hypothetical protein
MIELIKASRIAAESWSWSDLEVVLRLDLEEDLEVGFTFSCVADRCLTLDFVVLLMLLGAVTVFLVARVGVFVSVFERARILGDARGVTVAFFLAIAIDDADAEVHEAGCNWLEDDAEDAAENGVEVVFSVFELVDVLGFGFMFVPESVFVFVLEFVLIFLCMTLLLVVRGRCLVAGAAEEEEEEEKEEEEEEDLAVILAMGDAIAPSAPTPSLSKTASNRA